MALRINTNVAALSAHKNMIKNDNGLSASLEKLSSGLRINKAADDSSGMAIADSLRSQGLGLGQAIRNANDGISMVQTADGALDESINIVNTIKTKAIQAAQDGQTTESRKAIQADINKLTEELDIIAKTTAFNNQKLLSGQFTNKKFQVGAYSGETVSISIDSTESTKIGHISTSNLSFGGEGVTELNIYSNLQNETYSLNSIELAYDNTRDHSLGAVADAINKLSDVLGITADAQVETTATTNVTAGTTDSSFAINGVVIGSLTVQENDANGALVASINQKTDQHGVLASVDQEGVLTLTSTDDRAIQVTQGANTTAALGGISDTLGVIKVTQQGAGEVLISDANAQAGIAVSTEDGYIELGAAIASTTQEMTLAEGTMLAAATTIASGSELNGSFTTSADIAITLDDGNVLGVGSVLASGTIIGSGTVLQGDFRIDLTAATTNDPSTLGAGTVLTGGAASVIAADSVFEGDVSQSLSGGAVTVSGGFTYVTGAVEVKATGLTLTGEATLGVGSVLLEDSVLAAGTQMAIDITIDGDAGSSVTLTDDMTLMGGSTNLEALSTFETGTTLSNDMVGSGSITGNTTIGLTSAIGNGSFIADGSSLGGTATLADDVTVGSPDMLLAAGSTLAVGSTLTAGTVLTNDVVDSGGITYAEGETLQYDIITAATTLTNDQVVNSGSILLATSTLAANAAQVADTVESSTSAAQAYRLSDVDVTSQEGAQIAMSVADAALKSLDKVRSDLGSVQNQMTSTIANISATRVNIFAAESSIRDVDFAEEAANFSKMQILNQASSFAMAQANASSQNVLSLLQG